MSFDMLVLDLDGTLLNSDKQISPANYAALADAAARGVHIVPCTGRFFGGMPQVVRDLPFVRYAISVNGAEVFDIKESRVLHRAEIAVPDAIAVFDFLDTLPVVFDCFVGGWGWMAEEHYARIADFSYDPHVVDMVRRLRTPVPDLRAAVREKGLGVQKIQMFFQDMALRSDAFLLLRERFPHLTVTSSIVNNIEMNSADANKGAALRFLCAHLGVDLCRTIAMGDGDNDSSMLQTAGIGVAMQNADAHLRQLADEVTLSNDEDGVAHTVRAHLT